jgi:DNA-binding HxlR family transcriptional regulator
VKIRPKIYYCPVDYAFQRVGGKYKARILWYLKDSICRFGELKRLVEGISPKMLTQSLKELEEDNLITKKIYVELPPKVEYKITASGSELIPAIDRMRLWAEDQLKVSS